MPFGEKRFLNDIFGEAVRLGITLPLFILDDANLIIEFLLRHRTKQIAHPVTFKEERAVKRCGWHRLEIIGAVKPCGAVKISRANLLKRFKKITRRIFRTIEHQMLKQMCKSGFALWLIF